MNPHFSKNKWKPNITRPKTPDPTEIAVLAEMILKMSMKGATIPYTYSTAANMKKIVPVKRWTTDKRIPHRVNLILSSKGFRKGRHIEAEFLNFLFEGSPEQAKEAV